MPPMSMNDPELMEWIAARSDPFGASHGLGRTGLSGLFLGVVFGTHATVLGQLVCGVLPWRVAYVRWCCYVCALSFFHAMEFLTTARYKWRDLSYDSWLLNHSKAYGLAALAAMAEFWLEVAFAPAGLKESGALLGLGVAVVCVGHGARVAAMWTCGEHFAHRIMVSKDPRHRLVTFGIYRVLRHPSYTGWFWWSIGTQVVLGNPLCVVAYAYASWSFFADRIPFEEETLRCFYPDEYPAYAKRTWVLIPFIPAGDDGDDAKAD